MSRLKANEAKKIADIINAAQYTELKNRIDDAIREECEHGNYHVVFHYELPEEVILFYRDLGYKVQGSSYRNEVVFNVSWG